MPRLYEIYDLVPCYVILLAVGIYRQFRPTLMALKNNETRPVHPQLHHIIASCLGHCLVFTVSIIAVAMFSVHCLVFTVSIIAVIDLAIYLKQDEQKGQPRSEVLAHQR